MTACNNCCASCIPAAAYCSYTLALHYNTMLYFLQFNRNSFIVVRLEAIEIVSFITSLDQFGVNKRRTILISCYQSFPVFKCSTKSYGLGAFASPKVYDNKLLNEYDSAGSENSETG